MGSELDLRALGPLDVLRDAAPLELGSPLRRGLLGLLLLAAPHALSIERLLDDLWPADPPGDPLRNLQVHVSGLRKVLGAEVVQTAGKAYRLTVAPSQVDVVRFESAAARAAAALAQGGYDDAAAAADEAAGLWRGDAWADLRHLPAIEPAAVRLDGLRLDNEAVRARALLASGRHRELVPRLEELVRRHPLREDLVEALVLALHRSGRQPEALEAQARHRTLKIERTGLDPGQALVELHRRVLADDPALRVEEPQLRARRHLPAAVSRFFGREDEIGDLLPLLRDPAVRVVTLTGPGGIGKTRLSLALAHELAADHTDGVWFVALDDVHDPTLVPQTVAEALELEDGGQDFVALLRAHLRDRSLLLVLDNFEQVDEAAPLVSDLVAAAPALTVLVTSRTRLRLSSEHVREVTPLRPDAAVPLFTERARQVAPWFDVGAGADVGAICQALDRVPLALELVAARAAEISLSEMVAGLGARLDLAAYELRDRRPRHHSLRAAIDWSVDLLDDPGTTAFRRLGVFAGGWEGAAAMTVTDATAQTLAALERASLVRRDGEGRQRMLETVREHARELLEAEDDERDELPSRHADWCLEVAEAAVSGMGGTDRSRWLARLERERGNMRAALAWLGGRAETGEPDATGRLVRLAGALGLYWYRTTPGSEDVAWLRRALELGADGPPLAVGRAHYALAICEGEQGRVQDALVHARRAYQLVSEANEPHWAARVLNTLGGLTRDLGRPEEAVSMLDRAIAVRRRLADPALPVEVSLANRAMAALDLDDTATARACLDECLEQGDDPVERGAVQRQLADVSLAEGRPDEAAAHLAAAVRVLREHQRRYRLVECLESLAACAAQAGRSVDCAVLLAAADRELAEEGEVLVPADATLRARRTSEALAALDEDVRQRAAARGGALELDAALELGLRLLDPSEPAT